MSLQKSELFDLFSLAKAELIRANQDRRHPFRLCTLSTLAEYPAICTVVKRKTMRDLGSIIYTDSRSRKVHNLKEDENCSQLYYNPKKKLQVIIKGRGEVVISGVLYEEHKALAMKNPSDYSMLLPPGSAIDLNEPKTGEDEYFCLLNIIPESMEILELNRDQHRRALFIAKEDWRGTWLVP